MPDFFFLIFSSPIFHLQSRDRLLKALRAINAGDTADQVVRQVDKMIRNSERARENRVDRVVNTFSFPHYNLVNKL